MCAVLNESVCALSLFVVIKPVCFKMCVLAALHNFTALACELLISIMLLLSRRFAGKLPRSFTFKARRLVAGANSTQPDSFEK